MEILSLFPVFFNFFQTSHPVRHESYVLWASASWGSEFDHQNPHKKSHTWWCALKILALGAWRQVNPRGLQASEVSLLTSRSVTEPVSRNKVDNYWRVMIPTWSSGLHTQDTHARWGEAKAKPYPAGGFNVLAQLLLLSVHSSFLSSLLSE